jgi:hypothetical protein
MLSASSARRCGRTWDLVEGDVTGGDGIIGAR